VDALAGTPARLSLEVADDVAIAGQPISVSGRLHHLGSPHGIPGAPIELQRLRAGRRLTLAIAVTGPEGAWTAAVAPKVNVLLRALHRPSPATVSDWMTLDVAPLITLEVTSAAALQLAGTIAPPKGEVTVELHRGPSTTGRLVRTRRLAVNGGRFTGAIRTPRPGTYTLIARSAQDAENAAGASLPVRVKVS
jgi:hypothetical protein